MFTGTKPGLIIKMIRCNSKSTHPNHRNIKTQGLTSNVFIVLGALKSLLSFPLDIDVNDILNYCTS